jgi:transcription antitermination factor NusG
VREHLPQAQFDVPLWYALTVQPKHERVSAGILEERGFEPFAPFYLDKQPRRAAVERPLFPRYIFCRFEYDRRADVMRTMGVIDVVKFGPVAMPVPDEEIEAVRATLASGLPVAPVDFAGGIGSRAQIMEGPLRGLVGVVTRLRGETHVIVSVSMFNRGLSVLYPRYDLMAA